MHEIAVLSTSDSSIPHNVDKTVNSDFYSQFIHDVFFVDFTILSTRALPKKSNKIYNKGKKVLIHLLVWSLKGISWSDSMNFNRCPFICQFTYNRLQIEDFDHKMGSQVKNVSKDSPWHFTTNLLVQEKFLKIQISTSDKAGNRPEVALCNRLFWTLRI